MIAALGIDAPDYPHALAISAFGQWSLRSVTERSPIRATPPAYQTPWPARIAFVHPPRAS